MSGHCHILEHEEHDMMHALVVLPAAAATSKAGKCEQAAIVTGGDGLCILADHAPRFPWGAPLVGSHE